MTDLTSEPTLREACPFCGGGPGIWTSGEVCYVECQKCKAQTARFNRQEYAVNAWNRRTLSRAICRDDVGAEKSTAKIIAGWIREGRKVERHPMDEAMRRLKESCAAMGKPTP